MRTTFRAIAFLPFLAAASVSFAGTTGSDTTAYHHYLRGLLLESQGNFPSAREEIAKALSLAPDSAYLHRTAAELSLRLGQVNRAAEEIERANELSPKDVKSLILAGQIHWALGNTDKAEAKLKRAVEIAPDETEATVSLAGALSPREPKQAIQLYKNYLQRHPGDVGIWERLAQLYHTIGDTESAKGAWEKSLSWAPGSVRAHLALAQIAEVNRDTMTAIMHYEAVMVEDPTNLPLLLRVGELRYRNNEMAQAQDAFAKAKNIAPDSVAANFWMALLAENRGDWNEAISLLEKVNKEGPDSGVLLRLSYYYSQAGRYREAVKVLEKLVATQPSNTDFLTYLAIAHEQNSDLRSSEKALKRVLDIDTSNHEAHFQLATIYDRQKKLPLAEEQLKTAIALKPDYDIALNYLGYSYADRNIKLDDAERLLVQAVAIEPKNAAYLDSIGWLYFRKGDFERAETYLLQAVSIARDGLIFEHLAAVQLARGEDVAALLSLKDAMLTDPSSKSARTAARKLMKKMLPAKKADVFNRLSAARFGALRFVQGLVGVKVCKGPCFETNARFSYAAADELRVEIPGPLAGPVMLLVKKPGQKAEYGAVHPEFQNAEALVTRCFERIESVLTGAVFKTFDNVALTESADLVKKRIVADAGPTTVSYGNATGELLELRWKDDKGGDTLVVGASSTLLPSYFEWTDRASGISMRVTFNKPSVSTSLEREISLPEPRAE